MTITDRDIAAQVTQVVEASEGRYDVAAITAAFVQRFGLVDIDDVDADAFWALVAEHAIS